MLHRSSLRLLVGAVLVAIPLTACGTSESSTTQALRVASTARTTTTAAAAPAAAAEATASTTVLPPTKAPAAQTVNGCKNLVLSPADRSAIAQAFATEWGISVDGLEKGATFGECNGVKWSVAMGDPSHSHDGFDSQNRPIQDGPWFVSDDGTGHYRVVTDTGGWVYDQTTQCNDVEKALPVDLIKIWGFCN